MASWISILLSSEIFRHSFNQTIKNVLQKGQKSDTVGAIEQKVGSWNFQDNAPTNYIPQLFKLQKKLVLSWLGNKQ